MPIQDNSDHLDRPDSAEPRLAKDPEEITEANDPTEPIDRIDPTLPMDRIEYAEPMDRIEPSDRMDRIDRRERRLRTESRDFIERSTVAMGSVYHSGTAVRETLPAIRTPFTTQWSRWRAGDDEAPAARGGRGFGESSIKLR